MKTCRVKKLLFKQEEIHHLEEFVSMCTTGRSHTVNLGIIQREYSTGSVLTWRLSAINRDVPV